MSILELDNVEQTITTQRKLSTQVFDAAQLVTELKNAIEAKSFEVFYQPQYDQRSNSFAQLEALLRWNHAEMGFIPPSVFIPLAEECQLIEELTEIVIDRVADDLKHRFSGECSVKTLAINISARLISDEESAMRLLRKIDSLSDFAESIVLELTETSMVQNKTSAKAFLNAARNRGFRIALDDFGAGHSSLQYLLEFPIDYLKIDRSFVQNLFVCEKSRKIIASIVALSSSLGLELVAEGVETQEDLQMLLKLGCSKFQGFYFSKALPSWQVQDFLSAKSMSA